MPYDKVIDSAQLDGALTATADAIRSVKDSGEPIEWDKDTGFADALSDISSGLPTQEKSIVITENGTTEIVPDEGYALSKVTATAQVYDAVDDRFTKWIEGDRTVLYDPDATSVVAYFSTPDSSEDTPTTEQLTSVDLPNVTILNSRCFMGCENLTSINIPKVEEMKIGAFLGCTSLSGDLYFPELTTVGTSSGYQFSKTAITSFAAPKVTSLPPGIFENCTSLLKVSAPSATTVSSSAFTGCTALRIVDVRRYSSQSSFISSSLTAIRCVDAYFSSSLNANVLTMGGGNVKIVSIRYSSKVPSLKEIPTSGNFAIDGAGGYIICPSALIEKYKTSTNWSAIYEAGTCTFLATEDYTIDGTTTGELDWDKIEALIGDETV